MDVKSDREIRTAHIIINRFWNTDHGSLCLLGEFPRPFKGTIPPQDKKPIQAMFGEHAGGLPDASLGTEFFRTCGEEKRSPAVNDASDGVAFEGNQVSCHETLETSADAEDFQLMGEGGTNDGADRSI